VIPAGHIMSRPAPPTAPAKFLRRHRFRGRTSGRPGGRYPAPRVKIIRAMRRKLLPLCSAVSLLLFAATCALWVRSDWAGDYVSWGDKRGLGGAITGRGDVMVYGEWVVEDGVEMGEWAWGLKRESREPTDLGKMRPAYMQSHVDGFGFRYETGRRGEQVRNVEVYVPLWTLALASSVLPAARLLRRVSRARRLVRGRCCSCGYDLRATPQRCPECGAIAPTVSSAAA
jgi:hypothetical protein